MLEVLRFYVIGKNVMCIKYFIFNNRLKFGFGFLVIV